MTSGSHLLEHLGQTVLAIAIVVKIKLCFPTHAPPPSLITRTMKKLGQLIVDVCMH